MSAASVVTADLSTHGTIGELLRETRQSYGGDIAQIAAILRIRAAYLSAIEDSRYEALPAPVYALGFVRAYANHLGLDGDEAVRRFKQETVDLHPAHGLSFPVPLAERSVPGGTMLLAALILAFCGYGLWYYVSTGERARPERVSAVPAELAETKTPATPPPSSPAPTPAPSDSVATPTVSAADNSLSPAPQPPAPAEAASSAPAAVSAPPVGASSPPQGGAILPHPALSAAVPAPPPANAPAPANAAPPPPNAAPPPAAAPAAPEAPAASPPAAGVPKVYGAVDAPSRIVIHASKDSWIQVRDGSQILIERNLHPGDTYRVPDRTGLLMDTGNGAGLDIEVDGNQVPSLGAAVRHNVVLDPSRLAAGTAVPPIPTRPQQPGLMPQPGLTPQSGSTAPP